MLKLPIEFNFFIWPICIQVVLFFFN